MAKILKPKMDEEYISTVLSGNPSNNNNKYASTDSYLIELIDDCSDGTYNV